MTHRNINFIGYGSLLSHAWIRETLSDRTFYPVIVEGFKRIFNVDDVEERSRAKKYADILNIIESPGIFFNGVLFKIDEVELIELKSREDVYVFERVATKDYYTGTIIEPCFVSIDYNIDIDIGKKYPDKNYLHLCREAAYAISDDFGTLWDQTTYLSSGMPVSEYLAKKS